MPKKKARRQIKPRAPARRAVRRNPDASTQRELTAAVERYTGFRGHQPREVHRVQLPALPKVALTLGDCVGIMYRSFRGGRFSTYLHRFKKQARPTLCVSSDGHQLLIVGGRYSVTDRGIEDSV